MSANVPNLSPDAKSREKITLLVSPDQDDYRSLATILEPDWTVRGARSCQEAIGMLGGTGHLSVVACERELPDGTWKDLLQALVHLQNPPPLVVLSRHADESLWAEVLNIGGYDVLAKPLEHDEVQRVMMMARRFGSSSVLQ